MKIFIIPSWYPSEAYPSTGIFFREQAVRLAELRPEWKIGLGLWGSHEPQLWIQPKRPFSALIKLSSRIPLKKYQQMLSPNCIEFFTPALTWNRFIKSGNLNGIFEAQDYNFRLFTQYYGKPDLIHAQVSFPAGYLAMKLSRKHKIPYVITEHMSPFPMPSLRTTLKKYLLPALKQANLVLAVSKGLQDQLQKHGINSELIHNFIDEKNFCFHPKVAGPFSFLAMGRLEKQKGYELLLDATKKLVDKGVDFRLRIGGSGSLDHSLKRKCERLGLSDQVVWLGELTRAEVKAEMVGCHGLVSTSHHENQPVAMLEALAVGRPVLTTAWEGSDELIFDEAMGKVIPTRDPESFGEGMIEMIKKRYDFQSIASLFENHFGAQKTVDDLEEKFRKVLTK